MKAQVMTESGRLELLEVAKPDYLDDSTLVSLKAAALNHRDNWILKGQYAGIKFPTILGSDGAGITESGREVIIQPCDEWGQKEEVQSKDFKIVGLPENGTFAEFIAVKNTLLHDKPSHLSWEQAAALPLAGLTAFRSVFSKGQLKESDNVLITGVGGGVALFALQFATSIAKNVFVTSGSETKLEKAIQIGAKGGVNYKEADWSKQLKQQAGGFDLIIDSAGGEGFNELLKLANPGARIVMYGATLGNISFPPQILFWKQLKIMGSTMGSDTDFKKMLAFVNQYKIFPIVDSVFPLQDALSAIQYMDEGKQFGKIVISIS